MPVVNDLGITLIVNLCQNTISPIRAAIIKVGTFIFFYYSGKDQDVSLKFILLCYSIYILFPLYKCLLHVIEQYNYKKSLFD